MIDLETAMALLTKRGARIARLQTEIRELEAQVERLINSGMSSRTFRNLKAERECDSLRQRLALANAVCEAAGQFTANFKSYYELQGGFMYQEKQLISKFDMLTDMRQALEAWRAQEAK